MHHQTVLIQYSNLLQLVNCLCFKVSIYLQKQMLKVFAQKCSLKHQQRSSLPFLTFFPGIIPCLFKGNKPTGKG